MKYDIIQSRQTIQNNYDTYFDASISKSQIVQVISFCVFIRGIFGLK